MEWVVVLAGHIQQLRNPLPLRTPHAHDELELVLIIRGHSNWVLGNRKYAVGPGHLIWLFPGQPHMMTVASADFTFWVAKFEADLVRRHSRGSNLKALRQADAPGCFCCTPNRQDAQALQDLLEGVQAAQDFPERYEAGLGYLLLSAWDTIQSSGEAKADTELHPAVVRAYRALQEGDMSASLMDVVGQVGLSQSQLSRLFRRQVGMTMVQFRNRQRLERFIQLYGQGQRINMLDAALTAGFGSYPQFYRVFRDFMGCTPQEYNRSLG